MSFIHYSLQKEEQQFLKDIFLSQDESQEETI